MNWSKTALIINLPTLTENSLPAQHVEKITGSTPGD